METAFIFPGQGAQIVGMGRDFADEYPVAADLFEKANGIVGYNLAQVCFDGPQDRLDATEISQPAIFVTSVAILEVLRANSDLKPDVTAGLSLGEYTALYAAGVIDFQDALILVQKRGKAMQAAADASKGSMVSIIGLDEEKVTQLCSEASQGELLVPSNFNCPGQIVITGSQTACDRAEKLAEKFGAIKAVRLSVAGAFHSEMMDPAAKNLAKALTATDIRSPDSTRIIANINADYYNDPEQIRSGLVKQLVQPILWQKCMEKLLNEGVKNFYEIGPGRVLTGLMRRIHRKTRTTNISSVESLKSFLDSIN